MKTFKDSTLVKDDLFGWGLAGFGMADNGLANPIAQMGALLLVWILGSSDTQLSSERGIWLDDGIWLDTAIWYR
jgi:hypothetical protein